MNIKHITFLWVLLTLTLLFSYIFTNLFSFIMSTIIYTLFLINEFLAIQMRRVIINIVLLIPKSIFIISYFAIIMDYINGMIISEISKVLIVSIILFTNIYSDMIIGLFKHIKLDIYYSRIQRAIIFIPSLVYFYFVKAGEIKVTQFNSNQIEIVFLGIIIINLVVTLLETILGELLKSIRVRKIHNVKYKKIKHRIKKSKFVRKKYRRY